MTADGKAVRGKAAKGRRHCILRYRSVASWDLLFSLLGDFPGGITCYKKQRRSIAAT